MGMGLVSKGAKCNVSGCEEDAVRSINTQKVEAAGLDVESSGKKSQLCKKSKNESTGPPKAEIVVILTDEQWQKNA